MDGEGTGSDTAMNGRTMGVVGRALVVGLALSMGGCLTYSNYPPQSDGTWINARDTASIREPMAKALAHVIQKDLDSQQGLNLPESGPLVAINLPGGIRPDSYRWVAANAHPRAEVLSETTDPALPVYHIAEVAIRHSRVRVDVVRPITGLERGITEPVYVGTEVWMRGGTGARQIERDRAREVGTLVPPERFTIESIERSYERAPEPEADETQAEEAPVEEAPVEAAPADEAQPGAGDEG